MSAPTEYQLIKARLLAMMEREIPDFYDLPGKEYGKAIDAWFAHNGNRPEVARLYERMLYLEHRAAVRHGFLWTAEQGVVQEESKPRKRKRRQRPPHNPGSPGSN
jgi:hypothetical protein